ncbi:hypothetical protein KIN34_08770 [Cellulomonas sp. DKR-3]|uniref:Secreted protein n=1 Tax=Cellulomonas fulva TaxID=2835530 RepID=A0ABS5TZ58_9CELL|nr:hypothetical protein [Cellulomonas fulva]MBT0994377.1 hypothetical protein [Cellulomonas fulva]
MGAELLVVAPVAVATVWCFSSGAAAVRRRAAEIAELPVTWRRVHVAPDAEGCPGIELLVPGAGSSSSLGDLRARDIGGGTVTVEVLGLVGPGGPAGAADRAVPTGRYPLGEVSEQVDTAAGPAWRRTAWTESVVVTDLHLDHAGWAFVVRLRSGCQHDEVLASAERMLASWRWVEPAASQRAAG